MIHEVHVTCRSGALPVAGALIALSSLAPAIHGELAVLQPGFTVTALASGSGSVQVECSPGGDWGDFVYVANFNGTVDRIDFSGQAVPFASSLGTPGGLAFGPGPGMDFGNYLFVADRPGYRILKITPSGEVLRHGNALNPWGIGFDPSGSYGNLLFVPSGAVINRISATGGQATWSEVNATYVKFAPGGQWGTGMYAAVGLGWSRVSSDGVATPFVTGIRAPAGFAWATGSGFGTDLFAADMAGGIYQIAPDGTRTQWATFEGASDIAFCDGAMYVVGYFGERYRIDAYQVPTLRSTLGALKASYR